MAGRGSGPCGPLYVLAEPAAVLNLRVYHVDVLFPKGRSARGVTCKKPWYSESDGNRRSSHFSLRDLGVNIVNNTPVLIGLELHDRFSPTTPYRNPGTLISSGT